MTIAVERTACRLCGQDQPELLSLGKDLAFGVPGEFPLVRCANCGLVYLQERPTPDSIGLYYPPQYLPYRQAIQDEPATLMRWARRRNLRQRMRVVEEASPRAPGRVLDVGCSTGIFLDGIRAAGWETLGVELNPQAVDYARGRFGLEIIQGQLSDVDPAGLAFEAITLWDVLEHTYDPLETLQKANDLLVAGGIVVLTLPHWESLDRTLFGRAWIGYDIPRHLFSFPRPVLARLFDASGFQLERAYCGLSGYYTFVASVRLWANANLRSGWLRRLLVGALNLPGLRFLVQPAFTALDKLGRGGTLVVVARKAHPRQD